MKKILFVLSVLLVSLCFVSSSFAQTAIAGASAGASATGSQGQGQDQGQTQSTAINFPVTEQRAETSLQSYGHGYRGFPLSAQITYPGLAAHFAGSDPSHQFQSLKTILIYKDTFTVAELQEMKKNNSSWAGIDKHVKTSVNIFAKAEGTTETIQLFINKPEGLKVQLLGYVTAFADDEDAVSIDVMEEAALACIEAGGNAVHATGEGIDKFLVSSGWGIALGGNIASLSPSEKTGSAGFMGIGYSTAQAAYIGKPWLQMFILKVTK